MRTAAGLRRGPLLLLDIRAPTSYSLLRTMLPPTLNPPVCFLPRAQAIGHIFKIPRLLLFPPQIPPCPSHPKSQAWEKRQQSINTAPSPGRASSNTVDGTAAGRAQAAVKCGVPGRRAPITRPSWESCKGKLPRGLFFAGGPIPLCLDF